MKNKKLATTLLAGVMAFTAIGVSPAFAATGTKTATLNNAQVRFNNGKVQTIQCYNIDGYNFVRARDITNNLGMAVTAIQNGNTGIMVHPHKAPTSTSTPEKLTKKTAKVKVEEGRLIYDGCPSKAECFLLDGRYYFKLADFENAANAKLDVVLEGVEFDAKGDFVDEPSASSYPSISVEWNNDTKVIDVNLVKTDLQEIFDEIRGGKSATTKPDKEEVNKKDNANEKNNEIVATGVLTSAPKVGTVLANILIDEDEGAYLADGKVNWKNITEPYTYYPENLVGQCTWYAEGRLRETTGVDLKKNVLAGNTVSDWIDSAKSAKCPDLDSTTVPEAIVAGCIAVYEGHALFVEYVEYDSKGNPEKVYFTEGNTQHKGKYYPNKDGKVQVLDFDDFIERQEFVGYVVVK